MIENIPNELKNCKQWVNYKLVKKTLKDGTVKYTKPPCNSSGELIAINNTDNFDDFNTVKVAIGGGVAGVGFVFTELDNYIGVDLDNVVVDGEISHEAMMIIKLLDSYTELSVSKTGVHIICKGAFNQVKNRKGHIEIYSKDRYFTVTGDIVGTQKRIHDRSAELQELHDLYLLDTNLLDTNTINYTPSRATDKTDDKYLLDGLKHGKRLNMLMSGYRATADESQNDYNLLQELAYWSNCNIDLMKRAFFYSNFYQTKDDYHKRKACTNYLDRTIQNVIKNQRKTARETKARYSL